MRLLSLQGKIVFYKNPTFRHIYPKHRQKNYRRDFVYGWLLMNFFRRYRVFLNVTRQSAPLGFSLMKDVFGFSKYITDIRRAIYIDKPLRLIVDFPYSLGVLLSGDPRPFFQMLGRTVGRFHMLETSKIPPTRIQSPKPDEENLPTKLAECRDIW
jgi:hypothetical protein